MTAAPYQPEALADLDAAITDAQLCVWFQAAAKLIPPTGRNGATHAAYRGLLELAVEAEDRSFAAFNRVRLALGGEEIRKAP